MLHKTRGLVFRFTRYGETSIIVNIFTAQFGLQGYMVKGVRSRSAKGKIALYQPLTLLDLVVYHRENANLMHIREAKCIHLYESIHRDVHKTAIAMFINEVLNKAVKEESHAEDLCEFIIDSLIQLDQSDNAGNFHLHFLVHLSKWLGFQAASVDEITEGRRLEAETEAALKSLLRAEYSANLKIDNQQRRSLLDILVFFYARHVD